MARDYTKIVAWQRAHQLTLHVYKVTAAFPREELFGLTSQLRRAGYSTPNNIVEGSAYNSKKQYLKHLYIAASSLTEVEYLLLLSHDLGYLTDKQYKELQQEVKTVHAPLHGLIKAVEKETGPLGNIVALIAGTLAIAGTRCVGG
jgi:four helix bundle protein